MRRVLVMMAAIVLVTVSGAQAQTIRMTALLQGSNETPAPILNGAYAVANVTVELGSQTVSWNIDVFNLPSGMTAGHFHVGGPGLGGPTVVNLTFPTNISNDFNLSGSATSASNLRPEQGIRSWEDFIQALVGGQTYLNIHTTVNGGGEIRGQVTRVP
jgi:CHRD domain